MPSPPTRIGRFEILEPLGAGGMGVVYKARDTRLDREVAVKVLVDGLAADAEAVRRFEQEARAASSLNHPNIVTVFDAGTDGQTAYIVTELLEGMTLRDRLARGALAVDAALDFAIQIAAGLAAAHRAGIVHRDVKPQNIFVTRTGVVKLLDFGVARLEKAANADPADETRGLVGNMGEGGVVGTPAYMAPEQIRRQPADSRADIFAFGCVLHGMLSGVGPFERETPADAMAAVLADAPPDRLPHLQLPPSLERIIRRCLQKDPVDRFQSVADLGFALEAVRDETPRTQVTTSPRRLFGVAGALAALAIVTTIAVWLSTQRVPAVAPIVDRGPVVLQATTVVPSSARPIAPAVAPDGKWVAYIGLAGATAELYVQFLNAGPPVKVTEGLGLPLQNRTVVGGIDVLPDGSGIAVAGRPQPVGLWRVPGIWVVPAPLGGPPRRLTDRYASLRWSPDGRRIAAVIANPLVGDAVAVADADGQHEQVLVPAAGGMHLHQVAWGHDGRYVYYSRTLEPNHALGEIYRVAVEGGPPEAIVRTPGTAMFPAPTPDGRALVYAGDHGGDGLNIWWKPFDGSPERRLTTGSGEFTEPYISRDGQYMAVLALKRRRALVRVSGGEGAMAVLEPVSADSTGDSDPSVSPMTGRMFFTSTRNGRQKIWSTGPDGRSPVPLTSGTEDDRRPAVSNDGRQVAFVSNRNGRRSIWMTAADGGTPRAIVDVDAIDRVSWAPDGHRLVYAAAATEQATLWTIDVNGGKPVQLSPTNARVPAWSPVAEEIAFVALIKDKPYVHVVSPTGVAVREPIAIEAVSLPTALSWSPDGKRLGLINLPGRAAAEAWILDLATGRLRKVAELPAPAEFEGVSWTSDGRALVLGRVDHESEILLMQLGRQP